jgi:hypothetical protein
MKCNQCIVVHLLLYYFKRKKGVYTFLDKNHFFFTKKNELVRGRGEGNALPMDVLYTIKCFNFYLSNQK